MRIVKAGSLYFLIVFAVAWVLGPLREFVIAPRWGRAAGILFEAPFLMAAMILAARWVIRRYAIPRTFPARAAIGGLGLGILLVAEVAGVLLARRMSLEEYMASFDTVSGGFALGLFLLFAAVPLFVERP